MAALTTYRPRTAHILSGKRFGRLEATISRRRHSKQDPLSTARLFGALTPKRL